MSKRAEIKQRRQKKARQQQLTIIAGIVLVAVAAAAYLIYPTLQPVGEITAITPEEFPNANAKALGPADAKVVIQEFSDFQ
jgi:protein-disulfide isomerase